MCTMLSYDFAPNHKETCIKSWNKDDILKEKILIDIIIKSTTQKIIKLDIISTTFDNCVNMRNNPKFPQSVTFPDEMLVSVTSE